MAAERVEHCLLIDLHNDATVSSYIMDSDDDTRMLDAEPKLLNKGKGRAQDQNAAVADDNLPWCASRASDSCIKLMLP